MKCEICERGTADGVTLCRVNEKGVPGIWRCWDDMTAQQRADTDPEIMEIIEAIEGR